MSKMRNRNGYGTIVKLSGKRRKPFEVRVNTRMDSRNYPVYDVLGRYADRMEAQTALGLYNSEPYVIDSKKMTFQDLYSEWYNAKYNGLKTYSESSKACTKAAYTRCTSLYRMPIKEIRSAHMQLILDDEKLSHAMAEHIKNLFSQMFKYAMKQDYILKDYSKFTTINIEEDDEHGIPFAPEDIDKLWKLYNSGDKDAALPLILIYSGWRIQEFATCSINLDKLIMTGGVKTKASKNRIVPIHSKIIDLVKNDMPGLQNHVNVYYNTLLRSTLKAAGIETYHTCHDCRHTFVSLLSSAGVPDLIIKRLVGHANSSITDLYTHKDIDELRQELEKI